MSATSYDAIIIGTGQGGHPLAKALAGAGWKTAVIERGPVGGTCVNTGCTPTKTMIASARVAHLVSRAADYGVKLNNYSIDFVKIRERKRSIVEDFSGGSQKSLEKLDLVELYFGTARFTGPKMLQVESESGELTELTAPKIFINTGTRNVVPDAIEGIHEVGYLNNASIMELEEIPKHLVIIGGGYIGLEFGQMFRRFGSQVTIIQRGDQLLPREDEDVAKEIFNILVEDGIKIYLNAEAECVQEVDGRIEVDVSADNENLKISGSHLLLAAGQRPNSDELGLQNTEVEIDERGYIKSNARLETTAEGIWVIGDVKGGPAFTHISYDDFRVIRENLLNGQSRTIMDRLIPYTVFIDPQLGRVGLSEKEARDQGVKYQVAKIPMTHVARALETDETRGFMKALIDPHSQLILGCAILGIEGGEVMSAIQMAMMGKLPYPAIRDGVFAHPTLTESLNNLFSSIEN